MKKTSHINITAEALLKRAKLLSTKAQPPANNPRQGIVSIYNKRTLEHLIPLLQKYKHLILIKKLKDFLSTNWALINKTPLCYTALPDSDLTLLLCDVAQYIKDNSKEPSCALKLLMPTLAIESTKDGFMSLDKLNVRQVLKTHILGQEGRYLIPVNQLISLHNTPAKEWFNAYFDYQDHKPEMVRIDQDEFSRLNRHSLETVALCNAHKQYELCLKENDSLLAHLQQLTRSLFLNSAKGIGAERNAATGTYDAIIKFNEYYSKLDKDTKGKIPKRLKDEIEKLINLSSNPEDNINATENLETCIATRRDYLIATMAPIKDFLATIGLSAENKAILIAEKKKQLIECQAALKDAIKKNKYRGRDSLGLTRALLNKLKLSYQITSMNQVTWFMQLSASELKDFCQDESIKEDILAQFVELNTLILFIHATPHAQLTVILTLYGEALGNQLINSPMDIGLLLDTLNKEYIELICTLLKKHLVRNIKTIDDFGRMLKVMSPKQYDIVCKTIKEQISIGINGLDDFKALLRYLSPDQASALCLAIKDRIPLLIKNIHDFKGLLQYLSPDQCYGLWIGIKEQIPAIIGSVSSFKLLLKDLSPDRIVGVGLAMEKQITSFIKDVYELRWLLNNLSLLQCSHLCLAIKKEILSFVKSAADFKLLLEPLPLRHRLVVSVFWEQLHPLISMQERTLLLNTYFTNPHFKKNPPSFMFYCLVEDIKVRAFEFKKSGHIAAHSAALRLYYELKQASKAYYDHSIDYIQFKSACETAIIRADELNNHRGWKDIFAHLIFNIICFGIVNLGITSLGVLALCLPPVVNKVVTGSWNTWNTRFFDTNSTKNLKKIQTIINEPDFTVLCP